MAGHDLDEVHGQNAVEMTDPAVDVAIAEPGKATDEHEIADKGDPRAIDPGHDMVVAVRRSPVLDVQPAPRERHGVAIGEPFRRLLHRDDVVVRPTDAF